MYHPVYNLRYKRIIEMKVEAFRSC